MWLTASEFRSIMEKQRIHGSLNAIFVVSVGGGRGNIDPTTPRLTKF
jgi:hypothetical protein